MKRYVEGEARSQATLFPDTLEDYIAQDNPVRVVDAFVDEIGFGGMEPEATGRPSPLRLEILRNLRESIAGRLPVDFRQTLTSLQR